jgi:hypothetical protein
MALRWLARFKNYCLTCLQLKFEVIFNDTKEVGVEAGEMSKAKTLLSVVTRNRII